MRTKRAWTVSLPVVFLAAASVAISARQQPAVSVDADDLGGVVTSTKGPEADVWVIAETTDLRRAG
jgi:hypothetical protein